MQALSSPLPLVARIVARRPASRIPWSRGLGASGRLWALAGAGCLAAPGAQAHIKWFAPYDVAEVPLSVEAVLSTQFLLALAGFVLLMAGGFFLDRIAAMAWPRLVALSWQDSAELVLRAGTGAFFMALFTAGGVILTPELRTSADWTAWLQLGIAASMLCTRSCAAGGIGILV